MDSSFEAVRARKKPTTETVPIVLDTEWAVRLGDAQEKVNQARSAQKVAEAMLDVVDRESPTFETTATEAVDAQAALDVAVAARDALRAEASETIIEFKFRGLAMWEIDELIAEHRPTDAQRAEAKKNGANPPQWDVDTYPPALVHTAMVFPDWSLADVQALFRDPNWNVRETRDLYDAADSVSMGRRVVDLGLD